MRHPRQAFGRDELLEQVWGWSVGDQSTVTVHVRRLREKVERAGAPSPRIQTVWGVGYRYEPVDADGSPVIAWHDVVVVASIVAAVACVGALIGALALRRVRHRSVAASIVIALTAAAVEMVGIALVGADMVVSGHALVVLLVLVIAATVAALAVATVLARTLTSGSRSLGLAARSVGADAPLVNVTDPATAEQAALATELARPRQAGGRTRARARPRGEPT